MTPDLMDAALGDPLDTENPVGYAAVLAADERQEMLTAGELLLDDLGLNFEFVPAAYGGRLTRADRLAGTLRALWRRDPSLGAGYGFSSLIAAVNIWNAGSDSQRRTAARLLLANKKIAVGFHELDHGNDFAHADFAARPNGSEWLLCGRKEVVVNVARADAIVLFARTSESLGSRSHSLFLVPRAELPAGRVRDLPRFLSSGLRGVQIGGAEFVNCPVPADALVGQPGHGMEIALQSFLITRALLPAVCLGSLDTALRVTIASALDRRLYGGAVADIPYVRAVIARAFADLLAMDAFSAVGLRGLHLQPEAMQVYAPAVKSLASRILLDAFEELRSVLGAQSYLRQGPYAIVQKLARDAAPATFVHVSRAACMVTILPQLPRLARKSWLTDPPAPEPLFDLGGELPPLRFDQIATRVLNSDCIAGTLAEAAELAPDRSPASRFATRFRNELRTLREECAGLSPSDITIDASPAAFALVDRYTMVLAAACALGVWRRGGGRYPESALPGVLDRLAGRLSGTPVLTEAERESAEQACFDAAVERYRDRRLFDLAARRIPG